MIAAGMKKKAEAMLQHNMEKVKEKVQKRSYLLVPLATIPGKNSLMPRLKSFILPNSSRS
jgi:hypothetical protein